MLKTYFYEDNLILCSKENGGNVNYNYTFFKEGFEEWATDLNIQIADIEDLLRYLIECGYNIVDVYYLV